MKTISIGLDIGTQFCYVGYWDSDEGEFHQLNYYNANGLQSDETPLLERYGIPTDVAAKGAGYDNLIFGVEADAERNNGEYTFLSSSLKTAVRSALIRGSQNTSWEGLLFVDQTGENDSIFKRFLEYIKKRIDACLKAQKLQIGKIYCTYPGPGGDMTGAYMEALKNNLIKVFDIHEEDNIICKTEAQSAARFFSHYIAKNQNQHNKLCFIDVGAGTTDVSVMKYDEKNRCYSEITKPTRTIDFGGKIIDACLGENVQTLSALSIAKHKIALFETGNDGVSCDLLEGERGDVINCVKSTTQWRNLIKELRTNILQYTDNNTTVILLGATSRIGFIQEQIKNVFSGREVKHISEFSNTVTESFTDANFIALSAATSEVTEISTRVVPERIRGQVYLFKHLNGNNRYTFTIIADGRQASCGDFHNLISEWRFHTVDKKNDMPVKEFKPYDFFYMTTGDNLRVNDDLPNDLIDDEANNWLKDKNANKVIFDATEKPNATLYQCIAGDTNSRPYSYHIGTIFDETYASDNHIYLYFIRVNAEDEDDNPVVYKPSNLPKNIEDEINKKIRKKFPTAIDYQDKKDNQSEISDTTPPPPKPPVDLSPNRDRQPDPRVKNLPLLFKISFCFGAAVSLLLFFLGLCLTYLPDVPKYSFWWLTGFGIIGILTCTATTIYQIIEHGQFRDWWT